MIFCRVTYRGESPFDDCPTSVVNDAIASDFVAIIRPSSRCVVGFTESANDEYAGGNYAERQALK